MIFSTIDRKIIFNIRIPRFPGGPWPPWLPCYLHLCNDRLEGQRPESIFYVGYASINDLFKKDTKISLFHDHRMNLVP